MLCVLARAVVRAVTGDGLLAAYTDAFVVLGADFLFSGALELNDVEIAGLGHEIECDGQFASRITNSAISDIVICVRGHRFVDALDSAWFSNVTVYHIGNATHFELASYVTDSFFDMFDISTAVAGVVQVYSISNSVFSYFQLFVAKNLQVGAANKVSMRCSKFDDLQIDLAVGLMEFADCSAENAVFNGNYNYSNVYPVTSTLQYFLVLANSVAADGSGITFVSNCIGDCDQQLRGSVLVSRPRCSVLSANVCFGNPCNIVYDMCFGHGYCIDFTCKCEEGFIDAHFCAPQTTNKTTWEYNTVLLAFVVCLTVLNLGLAFCTFIVCRRKVRAEYQLADQSRLRLVELQMDSCQGLLTVYDNKNKESSLNARMSYYNSLIVASLKAQLFPEV